ncbi:MAG: hypothetical protein NZZ41_00795 [Candidatus Dojkabacteria bacterium]|nr:hypothetical protein [Candidatus Dojkabacteria bacterium]
MKIFYILLPQGLHDIGVFEHKSSCQQSIVNLKNYYNEVEYDFFSTLYHQYNSVKNLILNSNLYYEKRENKPEIKISNSVFSLKNHQ